MARDHGRWLAAMDDQAHQTAHFTQLAERSDKEQATARQRR